VNVTSWKRRPSDVPCKSYNRPMADEPLDPKTFFPWTVKYTYEPVFHVPNEPWSVERTSVVPLVTPTAQSIQLRVGF
jgi:hypothetical protein